MLYRVYLILKNKGMDIYLHNQRVVLKHAVNLPVFLLG